MTARYKSTFRDTMAFCFYHYLRLPMVLVTYGLFFAFMTFLNVQQIPTDAGVVTRIIIFLMVEIVSFAFLAFVLCLTTVVGMISRRNKTFLTDHTITLGNEGLTSETPYGRSEMKWAIVQKLSRSKHYIFIYVAQHSAHVVPRRAFRDADQWQSFYDFCKQKSRAA